MNLNPLPFSVRNPAESDGIGTENRLFVAGLRVGERVRARARENDVLHEFAGALTGAYLPGELDDLRDEWR